MPIAACFTLLVGLSACQKPKETSSTCDVKKHIEDNWATACNISLYTIGGVPIEWSQISLIYSSSNVVETVNKYNNSTCTGTPQKTITVNAQYQLGSETNVSTTSFTQIDFTLTSVTETPSTGSSFPASGTVFKRLVAVGNSADPNSSSPVKIANCIGDATNVMTFNGTYDADSLITSGNTGAYPTTDAGYWFVKY